MPIQMLFCSKSFPAIGVRAGVASGLVVRLLDVSFEVGLTVKSTPAVGANEGTCVCVCVDVFIETAGAGECSGTTEIGVWIGKSAEVHWEVVRPSVIGDL